MKNSILIFFLLFLSINVFGQKSGKNYRDLGQKALSNENFGLSRAYYDSAFQLYISKKHYASAALTYLAIKKLPSDSTDRIDHFSYMKLVMDSSQLYKKYDRNTYVLQLKLDLAKYYFHQELYDSSNLIFNQTMDKAINKFGISSPEIVNTSEFNSSLNYQKGQLDKAKIWALRGMSLDQDSSNLTKSWIDYVEYHLITNENKGSKQLPINKIEFNNDQLVNDIYEIQSIYEQGNITKAINAFNEIGEIEDSLLTKSVLLKYRLLEGTLLFEVGEFDKSLQSVRSYLPIANEIYTASHPLLANYYLLIGKLFYEKSDFGASKDFLEKLLLEVNKDLNDNHPLKAIVFYEYSKTLAALEKYPKALSHIDSVLVHNSKNSEVSPIFNGLSLGHKGIVLYHLNELDSADKYLNQSFDLLRNNLSNEKHVFLGNVLNDLGLLYQRKGENIKAIDYYLKSLEIYKEVLGDVHPQLGRGYNNVAQLYLQEGKFEAALSTFQKAMTSNIFNYFETSFDHNPKLDNVLSDFILLKSLAGKVEALEKYYQTSSDTSLLYNSLKTHDLITTLINKLRTGYISSESKHFLSEKTSYLYEKGIWTCLELYQKTQNDQFERDAFRFSEKSRTGILLSSIKEAKAKKIAGLPDSLLVIEDQFVKQISQKENELFEELKKGRRARNTIVELLRDEIFNLKIEYTNYISLLESDYRDYYQLKYDTYTSSVEDVQYILSKKQHKKDKNTYHVLEYFVGKKFIYRFQISPNDYKLIVLKKPEKFEGLVKGLRNSIKYQVDKSFLSISNELASILLPREIKKGTHFTIVPDAILSYLPFESLITEDQPDKKLKKQSFLISNATISYSYSATLSVEMTRDNQNKTYTNSFAGFAPVFSKMDNYKVLSDNKNYETDINVNLTASAENNEILSLPYSELELWDIHSKLKKRNFQTDAYFRAAASKANLMNQRTLNSRFLHFATHGLLDASNPDRSGILLVDSTRSDVLTVGEIYGLKMQPEIVSLSACETGLGKLVGGEGLVSFSRGFFYAGSKFVVVSLWKVDDLSTAILMKEFYGKYGTKSKKDIYKSFQKSRRKIIKSKKYDRLTDWFPFILIGMH